MSALLVQPSGISVDELKKAWAAIQAGQFRDHSKPGMAAAVSVAPWTPSPGERVVPVLGCLGSVGATTVAVAMALASTAVPVRVVECCTVTASGLAGASTAELGLHPSGWQLGRRDHVQLERAGEILMTAAETPHPTDSDHAEQLTILDAGWEIGHLLAAPSWLAETITAADHVVAVTTATVPGLRRLEGVLELLGEHPVTAAVLGPPRRKWPRLVDQSAGPRTSRLMTAPGRVVAIPFDRDLSVRGLDSTPLPPGLVDAAAELSTRPAPQPISDPVNDPMNETEIESQEREFL